MGRLGNAVSGVWSLEASYICGPFRLLSGQLVSVCLAFQLRIERSESISSNSLQKRASMIASKLNRIQSAAPVDQLTATTAIGIEKNGKRKKVERTEGWRLLSENAFSL